MLAEAMAEELCIMASMFLIVYDGLSKQAVAYRESRSPLPVVRQVVRVFPGDVFIRA